MITRLFSNPLALPIVGAIIAGISLALNIPGLSLPLAVLGVLLLAMWQSVQKDRRIAELENTRPNVVESGFEDEEVNTSIRKFHKTDAPARIRVPESFFRSTSGGDLEFIQSPISDANVEVEIERGPKYFRYYLRLRNVKTERVNLVDTEPVHARLSYYDAGCNPILRHEEPYWRGEKRGTEVVIAASSKVEGLCIAIWEPGKPNLFAFASDQSYTGDSFDPNKPELELSDMTSFLEVELFAGNLDMEPIWVRIENQGNDAAPHFEAMDKPPCDTRSMNYE